MFLVISLIGSIFVIAYLLTVLNQYKREKQQFEEFIGEKASREIELENLLHSKEQLLKEYSARLEIERQNRPDLSSFIDRGTFDSTYQAYQSLKSEHDELQTKLAKHVSERKSKEVRLGAIAETLTPFLNGFPYNPKNLRALGSPIDYIAFEEDEIVLLEVKSGDSTLSKKQKDIRKMVEEGKVRFETHRIDSKGLSIE